MDRVILYLWRCDIRAAQEVMLKEEGNWMTVNKIEEDMSFLSFMHFRATEVLGMGHSALKQTPT
jgi:hypothetical protein